MSSELRNAIKSFNNFDIYVTFTRTLSGRFCQKRQYYAFACTQMFLEHQDKDIK